MLTLLSPSKSVTDADVPLSLPATQPIFKDETKQLLKTLTKMSASELQETFEVSKNLAELNHSRYQNWKKPDIKRQALYLFDGDVYNGLDAFTMQTETADYAQTHLGILSGLYGFIRPFDEIQPYRLEMGTKLSGSWGNNLYDFWGAKIADHIANSENSVVLNCASKEYAKAFTEHLPDTIELITPRFMQRSKDGLKEKALFAKYARGAMARWVMDTQVESARELEAYVGDGFTYSPELSKPGAPVFIVPNDFSLAGRFTKD